MSAHPFHLNGWPLFAVALCPAVVAVGAAESPYSWHAPDRAAKVAALIPGRKIPMPLPEEFMAAWTRNQIERWEKTHKPLQPDEAYETYAKAGPSDDQLVAWIPDHISPFGRVMAGKPDPEKAAGVMVSYCPFCGQRKQDTFTFAILDPANPFHAVTPCCREDLYEREQDFPPTYKLRPDSTAKFPHLDGTVKEVPAHTFTDKEGVTWQLFPGTVVACHRWASFGDRALGFMRGFQETGDPLYVHKLAVVLDRVADVYYGLPLSCLNEIATGKDGQPLTRAEWEAASRPVRSGAAFGSSPGNIHFSWNRRLPTFSRGWVFQGRELIWVEPFARARQHPAFKDYSKRKYGDPEALDRKIMTKLMRELALMFESFALQSNYQDGSYAELMMLGILSKDRYLFDFAAGHQECVLYNHHYHDGMNGEGAPNYMTMLGEYYRYMADPKGWLELAPGFLKDHPFFGPASTELHKLHTVRGLPLEFADQHIQAFDGQFLTDPHQVKENEKLPSVNWPGYGIGILRVGGPGHRQEVFMTYDRVSLHGAADKLGIECWVDGVPVMREGGYAAYWHTAYLDKSRPEIQSLLSMSYPRPMFEVVRKPGNVDCWEWAHGPWAHNTVTVNELGTGPGWSDNEGFGDLVTFKGGESPEEPGAHFQVLDCRDLYSFERMGAKAEEFRRTLLAVEGPDGRPYVVDVLRLQGGRRHALYLSAWADPAEEHLPTAVSEEPNLAVYLDKLRNQPPDTLPSRKSYEQIGPVKVLGPAPPLWDVTWKTDYAAYAPFGPSGKVRPRPLPEEVGRTRLRLIGLGGSGSTSLLRGKGPWVAWIHQPLPNNQQISSQVGFRDAWDYVIESRAAGKGEGVPDLKSTYLHILEGFREVEQSVIKAVTPLPLAEGTQASEGVVALKLTMAGGHADTVVFQPRPGRAKLQDGLETDARYALVRRDAQGQVVEADMVGGAMIKCGRFVATVPGDFKGTIVDLIGDLTGTRLESALIVRPDSAWPLGKGLAGKQISVDVINNHEEAYTIEKVTQLPNSLLRVDLANHAPFSTGWYQVTLLDSEKPNRLNTNRQLWAGINTPWWWGCKAWFPERGKTYTILKTDTDRVTMHIAEQVDLKAEGIQAGDWFTIYAIQPGQKVTVPCHFAWCRDMRRGTQEVGGATPARTSPGPRPMVLTQESQGPATCYRIRATGTATITMPATDGNVWYRDGTGRWKKAKADFKARQRTVTIALPGDEAEGQTIWLVTNKASWLKLDDSGPPQITRLLLDDKPLEPQAATNLGMIPNPGKLLVEARDADNPIDERSIAVCLDSKRIDGPNGSVAVRMSPADRKSVTLEVDLARTLAEEPKDKPARHTVTVTLDDFAVDRETASFSLTYNKRITVSGNALYLSDLQEISSFIHGGLRKDTDYYGNPLRMYGAVYGKSLHTHPENAATGPQPAYAEVVYNLPQRPARKRFCAIIGVCDTAGGFGSVVFHVQVAKDGEWETRYTSPVLRGGQEPIGISVDLSGATKLKLFCTDAGDGIGSDHAAWAEARLE